MVLSLLSLLFAVFIPSSASTAPPSGTAPQHLSTSRVRVRVLLLLVGINRFMELKISKCSEGIGLVIGEGIGSTTEVQALY